MNRSIINAIMETYKKYGIEQAINAVNKVILENEYRGFTNTNGVREQLFVDNGNQEEFKNTIFNQYILDVLNSPLADNMLEQAIKETYKKYQNRENVANIVKRCLNDFYNGNNHFTRDSRIRENLGIEFMGLNEQQLKERILENISRKVVSGIVKELYYPINNVKVYGSNIQRAQQEMITGLTHDKEGSIQLANMQVTTSIGKKRSNQEDAVLLKIHPSNPNFKILLVSDGMGGGIEGEDASHTVVTEISKWFDNIQEQCYQNTNKLKELLDFEIQRISRQINLKHNGKSGATIVAAIIGKDDTLIANVGDSRAYAVKGQDLVQITRDQSQVQILHNLGIIKQKDDMRFHTSSNIVQQILGVGKVKPQFTTLKNNEYDKLLLFSDGVTDCLSDDQIKVITQRSDRKKVTEEIVKGAIENTSYLRPELCNNPEYYQKIAGGKDNTTAVAYENER